MNQTLVKDDNTGIAAFIIVLAVAGLLFFAGFSVKAQTVYLGAKGGFSLPELSGGTNEVSKGWKSRAAFNFGVFSSYEISKVLDMQVEVNYASQGGQKNGLQPIPASAIPLLPNFMTFYGDFKNTAILNYIEVPVLAKYKLLKNKTQDFYIDLGPYFGYLINAHNKTSGTSTVFADKNGTTIEIPDPQNPGEYIPLPPQNFDANTTITSDINRFNVGVNGGFGVGQKLGQGLISLDLRGYYGFLNIQKDPVNGKNNTGALVLSLGYAVKVF
jgi:hypothetical protein